MRKIISHGTTGIQLMKKKNLHLNLTGVKRIDKLHNEEDWFSWNITKNHFYYSSTYISSNIVKAWKMMNKKIRRRYPTTKEKRQPKLISVIQVWVYDDRFKSLPLILRNYTKHYCIKNHIKLKETKIINFDGYRELLNKEELLNPFENILIFGKDFFNYFCDFNHARDYYHIHKDTKIIIDNTYLETNDKKNDKYNSDEETKKDKTLTEICNKVLDEGIDNYIIGEI